jgi:sodium-dependent phosphate transporter
MPSFLLGSDAIAPLAGGGSLDDGYLWMPIVAGFAMFYMAWGIGANDVANAFATSFGAKSITLKQAILVATFCEFLGAFALGSEVSATIRKGIVSIDSFGAAASPDSPEAIDGRLTIMCGMMSSLMASAIWLHMASKMALPVSTTHTIVGGVIGFVVVSRGYGAVDWSKVAQIVASWLISPMLSCAFGALSWALLKAWIYSASLSDEAQVQRAKMAIPGLTCLTWAVVIVFMIYKGAKGLGINDTPLPRATGIGFAFGACFGLAAYFGVAHFMPAWRVKVAREEAAARAGMVGIGGGGGDGGGDGNGVGGKGGQGGNGRDRSGLRDSFILEALNTRDVIDASPSAGLTEGEMRQLGIAGDSSLAAPLNAAGSGDEQRENKLVEHMFRPLNVLTAAFESFAHGANDVANSIGPFNAVVAAYDAPLASKVGMPEWILVIGGVGIVVGLWTYGEKVMRTMGKDICYVTPSRAFCIELSATFTILFATNLGLPVSTTHASVGAVIGIGCVDGPSKVNWGVLRGVFTSWITTLPAAAMTTAAIFGFLLPAVTSVCPAR